MSQKHEIELLVVAGVQHIATCIAGGTSAREARTEVKETWGQMLHDILGIVNGFNSNIPSEEEMMVRLRHVVDVHPYLGDAVDGEEWWAVRLRNLAVGSSCEPYNPDEERKFRAEYK